MARTYTRHHSYTQPAIASLAALVSAIRERHAASMAHFDGATQMHVTLQTLHYAPMGDLAGTVDLRVHRILGNDITARYVNSIARRIGMEATERPLPHDMGKQIWTLRGHLPAADR